MIISPMLSTVTTVIRLLLLALSLRGLRWAYVGFIALALVYFPARVGFRLQAPSCEGLVSPTLAVFSLTNYAHIILFGIFFVVSSAQTGARPSDNTVLMFCTLATLAMGALVELGEGVSGRGHCRLRDLIPDSAGAAIGALVLIEWKRVRNAPTLNPFVFLRSDRPTT